MKARKFDTDFDDNKDLTAVLDISQARQPLQKQKGSMSISRTGIDSLNREVKHLDITQQSIIKTWLAERLEQTQTVSDELFIDPA